MDDTTILVSAVAKAAELLGAREVVGPEHMEALTRGGVDPVAAIVGARCYGGSEIAFRHEHRTSFRLCTEVEMSVGLSGRTATDPGEAFVSVKVSWASGGGEVSSALAQLEHHMALVKKAALAEEILRDAVRGIRTAKRLEAALTNAGVHFANVHETGVRVFGEWREAKKAKETAE